MHRGDYYRITKGYTPIEPTTFPEKVFYVFWLLMYALKILLIRVRLGIGERNNETEQEER